MARNPRRLILSFIGNTDLTCFKPQGENTSPIRRLLRALNNAEAGLQPFIPPSRTRLVLFDDDRGGRDDRARFCETLTRSLPELGLAALRLERCAIDLPDGPTDLKGLYETVWSAIPTSGPERADEIVFHLSSGTPAMQFTLLLAAQCLRLDRVRLIETSREQHVREVALPYVLAARAERLAERTGARVSLPAAARRGLLPDSVIEDPHVQAEFAALYKAAINRKRPQRMLVRGPVGSGKWQACRQFAAWRAQPHVQWHEPGAIADPPEGATLLIRWLDTWSESALRQLRVLADERPDLAIAASYRTDLPSVVPQAVLAHEGLCGALEITLPALGARSDLTGIAESLTRQLGLVDGKVKARLQYELLTDSGPRNLHDLKTLLATAAAHSPGAHLERGAYIQARQIRETRAVLDEAWAVLAGMDFGPGRHGLAGVLNVIRTVVVLRALATGRNQMEVGEMLGYSQQTVSDILNKTLLDLGAWRTLAEYVDGAA